VSNADILAKLIEEDFGLNTREGSRYGNAEEHDSLVLDKERGLFFWNSEGIAGDPFIYLTKVRKYTPDRARDFLKQFSKFNGTYVHTIRNDADDVVAYPELVSVFFEDGRDKRDYFYRRGLTDATIDRFQCGYWNGWYTVPFFENGTFRNFQLRRDEPVKSFRSYYKTGPLLFNSDILKYTDRVYFVEGPVDAMAMAQNGLAAISTNMSGNFLPEWYGKFVRTKMIYIVMDDDRAGETEAIRLAKMIGETRSKIFTFGQVEQKGYDPVDWFRDGRTGQELVELVEQESKYLFELKDKERWKRKWR
jgi:DNA primase